MSASETLQKSLGVHVDPEALRLALTHRSYAYENEGLATNERLEFLGDAVLQLVVTDYLFRTFGDLTEGDLAKLRPALVSTRALARIARTLLLGPHIRLGAGELRTQGAEKDSILADTVEAIIGAVYSAHGFDTAQALVLRLVTPLLSDTEAMTAGKDWKTTIQELAAARDMGEIRYLIEDSGPDHRKSFRATYGQGTGSSKKEAERDAARVTVEELTGGRGQADVLTLVLDRYEATAEAESRHTR